VRKQKVLFSGRVRLCVNRALRRISRSYFTGYVPFIAPVNKHQIRPIYDHKQQSTRYSFFLLLPFFFFQLFPLTNFWKVYQEDFGRNFHFCKGSLDEIKVG